MVNTPKSLHPALRGTISKCAVAGICLQLFCAGGVFAQEPDAAGNSAGLWFRSASVGTGFANVKLPPPLQASGALPLDALNQDLITSLGADIDWQRQYHGSSWAIAYSPSYAARVRNSNLNSLGHHLTFSNTQQLGKKWSFGIASNLNLITQEQSQFLPIRTSALSSTQSSFDDLSQGILTGQSSNAAVNSALQTPALVESLGRTLFYGNQVLTTIANASISYAYSQRLSIQGSVGISRMQSIGKTNEPGAIFFPNVMQGSANVSVNYSLSPRTTIAGSVNTVRSLAGGLHGYGQVINGTFSRTMSRRWFMQTSGGVGYTHQTSATATRAPGSKPAYTESATLGFKTFAHTITVSHYRGFTDGFGFGFDAVWTNTVGWNWQEPGRRWTLSAAFAQVRAPGNFSSIYSFLTSTTFSRALTRGLSLTASYVWDRHGSKGFEGFSMTRNTVQVGIFWNPNLRLL